MCRRALRGCRRSFRATGRRDPGLDDRHRLPSAHRAPPDRRPSPSRVAHARPAPADRIGKLLGRGMSAPASPGADAAALPTGLAELTYELLDAHTDTAQLADGL